MSTTIATSSDSPAWELIDVRRTFRARGSEFSALAGINLRVHRGERVAILGESGSGKTTLARVGLGLIPPSSGDVRLFGESTRTWSAARWRQMRHRSQLLFQDPRAMLNPAIRIGALLRESARLHRPDEDASELTSRMLAAVGLADRGAAFADELSGGERRRAGLARVLLAKPDLLVADEPTAGLDAGLKADLIQLMLERVGPECAVVLITHDLPLALWCCRTILVVHQGLVVDVFRVPPADPPGFPGRHEPHPQTVALFQAAGLDIGRAR